ncbi:MAG: DUF5615 family PIN-like protein [Actinomycetes bacterium]
MRLLLDEMFSPLIARGLRDLGHDAVSVGEVPEWRGIDDAGVMQVAREQGRAVVTNNIRDFVALHNWAISPGGEGHCGLILVPSTQRRRREDAGTLQLALEELMVTNPGADALHSALVWLAPIQD